MTKLLIRFKRAKRMTTSPAVLKKIPRFLLLLMLNDEKLRRARTGRVPRAKKSIVSAPSVNPPVERV